MKRTYIILISSGLLGAAVIAGAAYYFSHGTKIAPPGGSGGAICTMEAMLCPDGSYVGRTGPRCEFSPCPGGGRERGECGGPGDSCPNGYVCIQECGPPVARENDPPPGWYCEDAEVAKQPRMCPICLASATLISTPDGPVKVSELRAGMTVWSTDDSGDKRESTVKMVSHTQAPPSHKVVHLVLSDGRETWVSPSHPTADGRTVGDLSEGDSYDGESVRSADLVPYGDGFTYDLLPDSETGLYWADGILLGSSLK